MSFKTELHCNSRDISPCSHQDVDGIVEKYTGSGYASLVLANHAGEYIFDEVIPDGTWKSKVDYYFDAAEKLRDAAGDRLTIIDGMELRFNESINDYLVFGVTREKFYDIPDVFSYSPGRFHDYAKENDMLFIQAHPMRFGMTLTSPDCLDGYEIFNGHQGQRSHNDIAKAWAEHFNRHSLILTSGSDSHELGLPTSGGIVTDEKICSSDELLSVLRSGSYSLIRTPLGDAEY